MERPIAADAPACRGSVQLEITIELRRRVGLVHDGQQPVAESQAVGDRVARVESTARGVEPVDTFTVEADASRDPRTHGGQEVIGGASAEAPACDRRRPSAT